MRRTKYPNKPVQLTEQEKNESMRRAMMFRAMAASPLYTRLAYGGSTSFGGLRDVAYALGYPGEYAITFANYYYQYKRNGVASKIIEKPVESSWRRLPVVRGTDQKDGFKEEWESFEKRLKVYSVLQRAEILSRIGRYGVLLIGYDDNAEDLSLPVENPKDVMYLQPFHENSAKIKSFVVDAKDPRYGQPEMYSMSFTVNMNLPSSVTTQEKLVHYSRVLHITDNRLESDIYGVYTLERGYNRLLDIEKVVGGSAEMYWQGALPGLALKMDPETTITQDLLDTLETEIKNYVHNMERYMRLQGIEVQQLTPQVVDPKGHLDAQLRELSIMYSIPKRILEGSERGELSSSQDTEAWDDYCDGRRRNYVEPFVLRQFVDKMIEMNILKKAPQTGYDVEWPDLSAPSDKDLAETGRIRSEAIAKYADSLNSGMIIPPEQFFKEVMEFSDEKVKRIIDAAGDILNNMLESQSRSERGQQTTREGEPIQ